MILPLKRFCTHATDIFPLITVGQSMLGKGRCVTKNFPTNLGRSGKISKLSPEYNFIENQTQQIKTVKSFEFIKNNTSKNKNRTQKRSSDVILERPRLHIAQAYNSTKAEILISLI